MAFTQTENIDLSVAKKELSGLGSSFTPEDVVAYAANPKTALHSFFEWDDSVAAKKWRLHQARNLILSIELEDGIRAYESVVVDGTRSYVSTKEIIKSHDLISQVLDSALSELIYWRDKNQRYKEYFGGVFDSINDAEKTIRRKNGKNKKGGRGAKRDKARNSTNKKASRDGDHLRRIASTGK